MGGEHDPDRATAPQHVVDAAGQRAQLVAQRWRGILAYIVATGRTAQSEIGQGQGPNARILAGAPVMQPAGGDVANPAAERRVPALPLLLVATSGDGFVEAANPLERPASNCHVRPPDQWHVAVRGAEVEGGDRRRLAPAAVRAAALQPRPDRAAEHIVVGRVAYALEQSAQPARGRVGVIVDEHDKLAARRLAARVSGRVQASGASQLEEACAATLSDRARARIDSVAHHEHLGAGLSRLGQY